MVVATWYPATLKSHENRIITGLPAISGTEFLIPSPALGGSSVRQNLRRRGAAAAVDRVPAGRVGGLMVPARRLDW